MNAARPSPRLAVVAVVLLASTALTGCGELTATGTDSGERPAPQAAPVLPRPGVPQPAESRSVVPQSLGRRPTPQPAEEPEREVAGWESGDRPATSPRTPPTSRPSRQAVPKAKNGTEYRACRDGACEVAVKAGTKIALDAAVAGFTTLEVTKVAGPCVDFRAVGASAQAVDQQPGFRARLVELDVVAVTVDAPYAVLRLSPA